MSYQVNLRQSKQTFTVLTDETILEAAEKAGIILAFSCRSGTCRSCLTKVLVGCAEHDPEYADELSIDALELVDGYRLLCSALACSDIELDK